MRFLPFPSLLLLPFPDLNSSSFPPSFPFLSRCPSVSRRLTEQLIKITDGKETIKNMRELVVRFMPEDPCLETLVTLEGDKLYDIKGAERQFGSLLKEYYFLIFIFF